MLQLLKSSNNARVVNCHQALTTPREMLTIDTSAANLVRDYNLHVLDSRYVADFNKGDTIYSGHDPFATDVFNFRGGEHSVWVYDTNRNTMLKMHNLPREVGTGDVYIRNNTTDELIDVRQRYGSLARSRITERTIDQWILYWGIIDAIESLGSITHANDGRIPHREFFLPQYRLANWTDDFIQSHSLTEAASEIQRTLQKFYCPIKCITDVLGSWISDDGDAVFSVKYNNHVLEIKKLCSIDTAGYLAAKENHPFAEVLKFHNLL